MNIETPLGTYRPIDDWVTAPPPTMVAPMTSHPDLLRIERASGFLGLSRRSWLTLVEENGDIWVADGYRASLVHRLDATGKQIQTLDGTEGAETTHYPRTHLLSLRLDINPGRRNNRANIATGKFNSPHSATADTLGNIYVVEWITGGRVTKLEKVL